MNRANYLWLVFCLLFLSVGTQARDLYEPRQLSERELLQTYTALMVDGCHHADKFWKTSSFDPAAGYWGNGISDGNEGIRAISEMVFTCGTLLKFSETFSATERQEYLRKATAAMRYAI